MSIKLSSGASVYEIMLTNFSKTLTYIPVTKTINNLTGEETLTDGSSSEIKGVFYRQEDTWSQDKNGLFQGADAILMTKTTVIVNKNDKIVYNGETYRVDKILEKGRELGEVPFYNLARLYLI